jgi:hypothetical protein
VILPVLAARGLHRLALRLAALAVGAGRIVLLFAIVWLARIVLCHVVMPKQAACRAGPVYDPGMRAGSIKLLLAAALLLGLVGCATTPETRTAEGPNQVCREEALTGSHVSRITCRPIKDAERQAADQEAMRRAQTNTQRPTEPNQ